MKKSYVYIYTFILIILSSRASYISNSWFFFRLVTFVTFIVFLSKGGKFNKQFFLLLLGYISITILQYLKFGSNLNLQATANYFTVILYVFLTIKILKQSFFYYFEKIVYQFSLISIPLYFIQLTAKPLLFSINKSLQFLGGGSFGGALYSNSLIFTFRDPHWTRNCGFMWEPGGFGAILTIAIIINIIYNNFRFNKHLIIFVVAALTTLSTATYVNLIFVFLFFYINCKYKNKILILGPVAMLACMSLFQFSFLADKITSQVTSANADAQQLQGEYAKNQDVIQFGRFASLLIDLEVVKDSFIIGKGFQDVIVKNYTLNLSNGIGDYYFHFGLIGVVLLILGYYYTLKRIFYKLNYKGIFIAVLCFLAIDFSNPLLFTPIMVLFQFYCLFNKDFDSVNKYLTKDVGVYST